MSEVIGDGTTVGAFTVRSRIGVGASAFVYDAADASGARVALKVLREEACADADAIERMKREADVLRSVEHPAIARVLASGALEDGRPWIALRMCEGETLRARIDRGLVARDASRAWALLRPICEGLAVVHASGVIHRDVKPENIIVSGEGDELRVCLVDFGLARPADASQTALTGPGVALGTPAYMAPELWWNADVTASVDQYSVACVLYELLTGAPPFAADSFGGWMEAHMHGAVRPVVRDDLSTDTRVALDALFRRALAKERGERFDSIGEFARAVDGVLTSDARRASLLNSWTVFIPLVSLLGPALVGHGGSHSPRELFRLAGYGAWLVLACTFVAAWGAWRRSAASVFAGVLGALLGLFGAATGWSVVLSAVDRTAPEGRFSLLHQGLIEADVNRAMGYWVAWGAALATLLAMPRAKLGRARWGAALAPVIAFALLVVLGERSAALCAGLSSIVMMAASTRARSSRDEALAVLVLSSIAVLAGGAASLVAHDAAQARVWDSSLDRALRVDRLTDLAREGSSLAVAWALSAASLIVVSIGRWRSLRWRTGAVRAQGSLVLLVLVAALLDGAQRARVSAARDRARAALSAQFALFSRLDLVAMTGLAAPHVAPSVQLAQDVVAIDGVAVVRASALSSPSVRATLAQDLSHRLARERTSASEQGPRWTLAVDRRAPFARVLELLAIAREVGAGPCELLFAKGAAPRWSVWTPPESALLVPSDYGALELRFDPAQTDAVEVAGDRSFADVATTLRSRARAGVVTVR